MKIVIDIPESIYDTIEDDQFISRYQLAVLQSNIRKGVPLPKEHRFIDADEILNNAFITEDEEDNIFVQKYYCIKKEVMDNALVLFDTLEADKAESEVNTDADSN